MFEPLKMLLNSNLTDIKKGYMYDEDNETFVCLICGDTFVDGRIYNFDDTLFEAKKAIKQHIIKEHSSVFEYLLNLDKKHTGFTDHQKNLLKYFYNGYNDKEICNEIGGSTSTIRNYRFSFKEKEKQAKILLAIMELLKEHIQKSDNVSDFNQSSKLLDSYFSVTKEEYDKILRLSFQKGLNGPLTHFPKKQKGKLIVLSHIVKRINPEREYTEKEINALLQEIYPDFVTIRRYLIDFGLLNRKPDGSKYWLNPKQV